MVSRIVTNLHDRIKQGKVVVTGRSPLIARFWAGVNKDGPVPEHVPELGPCWVWEKSTTQYGYGQIGNSGNKLQTHRVSWVWHFGKIPEGQIVLHKCDNRACVNPDHLFLGTKSDNTQDMYNKGRSGHTTCPSKMAKGEKLPFSKLNESKVRTIRNTFPILASRLGKGCAYKTLSKRFGVSVSQIWWVLTRRSWKHVV